MHRKRNGRAVSIPAPLSILCLRCVETVQDVHRRVVELSILYLRCRSCQQVRHGLVVRRFQFSIWDAVLGPPSAGVQPPPLSILYLRCRQSPPPRHTTLRTSLLSILYLRCANFTEVQVSDGTISFQFSIWDAQCRAVEDCVRQIIAFNSLFEMHNSGAPFVGRERLLPFNSLFEMLIVYLVAVQRRDAVYLSILYLRCGRASDFFH